MKIVENSHYDCNDGHHHLFMLVFNRNNHINYTSFKPQLLLKFTLLSNLYSLVSCFINSFKLPSQYPSSLILLLQLNTDNHMVKHFCNPQSFLLRAFKMIFSFQEKWISIVQRWYCILHILCMLMYYHDDYLLEPQQSSQYQ